MQLIAMQPTANLTFDFYGQLIACTVGVIGNSYEHFGLHTASEKECATFGCVNTHCCRSCYTGFRRSNPIVIFNCR